MKNIVSLTPLATAGKNLVAVIMNSDVRAGEIVEVSIAGNSRPPVQHKVAKVRTKQLGRVNHQDLVGFIHSEPKIFYGRVEKSAGTGLPSNTDITFVTLSPAYEVEDPEELERQLFGNTTEEIQPIKPRRRSKRDEENDEE